MKNCTVFRDGRQIMQTDVADHFWFRLKGLMFRKQMRPDAALLITPCGQIHTFFMNFDIDAVFIGRDGKVLHIEENMKPGKVSPFVSHARAVLELSAGSARRNGISPGSRLTFPGRQQLRG